MSLGGIVTILSSVVFYYLFGDNPLWPALSILTGELIITVLDSIAIQEQNFWKKRLQFILPAISTLGVPLLLKNTISNEWILYLLFLIALTLITFVFRKKWIDL
jgi:phosphatidylglycerophosphate synthase